MIDASLRDPRADPILVHVLDAIAPASAAHGEAARRMMTGRARDDLGSLGHLAVRLAAARHAERPAVERKHAVVCAADHGLTDTGADLGRSSPTIAAMEQIAAGRAAINAVARTAGAAVSVVDCGARGGRRAEMPGVMDLRVGDGTADIRSGPAMSAPEALASVRTGVALMLALADAGADCVALGQLAPGGHLASAALIRVLTGAPNDVNDDVNGANGESRQADEHAVRAALLANRDAGSAPLAVLAALGGYEIGVMAGLVLAAASLRVPVIIDDQGTSAAALVAARLAPDTRGYLVASHAGRTREHQLALRELGLAALFDLGLAHGEGTGSCLALPVVDSAARILRDA